MDNLKLYGKSENEIKGLVSTVEVFSQDIGTELKYLGILEYDRVKKQEMKDKFRNEYFRRTKLILKSKLNGRNKIMALNTWAVSILRYGAGILKWNKNELQEMDRKTRKFMTMNKELHPRSDVAQL